MLQLKIWGPHGPLLGKVGGPMGPHRPQRRAGGRLLLQFSSTGPPEPITQNYHQLQRWPVYATPARPPAAAVGGVPWGPLLYPEGAHGAPYFYPAGDPGPPTFTQKGPMGPLTVVFPPGKKFSQLCCEKFFPLHGRVRGPMGPPTFTQ